VTLGVPAPGLTGRTGLWRRGITAPHLQKGFEQLSQHTSLPRQRDFVDKAEPLPTLSALCLEGSHPLTLASSLDLILAWAEHEVEPSSRQSVQTLSTLKGTAASPASAPSGQWVVLRLQEVPSTTGGETLYRVAQMRPSSRPTLLSSRRQLRTRRSTEIDWLLRLGLTSLRGCWTTTREKTAAKRINGKICIRLLPTERPSGTDHLGQTRDTLLVSL
jgi:hypothetical protein